MGASLAGAGRTVPEPAPSPGRVPLPHRPDAEASTPPIAQTRKRLNRPPNTA
ncbi:putative protein without homology [Propionibacterium freudenreichii subsp. shermanii]|nr:putative protein without homology [Propionibacterium freudenreichii subsp. shermanii]